MHPTFDHFTQQATGGHGPYRYQSRLAEQGMSLRDVGAALGVSYQRAHQLVSS